mgnify:CR=1 FL=1
MSNESIEKRARELLAKVHADAGWPGCEKEILGGAATFDVDHGLAMAAIIAALEPQWQPIETAPRDGTVILLGRAGDEADDRLPISVPGRWFKGYEDGIDYMGHDDGFMDVEFQEFSCPRSFGAESYRSEGFQPTHWMPLPAPPEVA